MTATSRADPGRSDTVQVEVVDAGCVVGEWRLREQAFLDQIAALVPDLGTISHQGGQYLVSFAADGSCTGRRMQWPIGVSTPAGLMDLTIDSVETGTWIVDTDGESRFVNEATSNASVTMSVNGLQLPGGDQETQITAISGQADYSCEGDVLEMVIIDAQGTIVATLDRHS